MLQRFDGCQLLWVIVVEENEEVADWEIIHLVQVDHQDGKAGKIFRYSLYTTLLVSARAPLNQHAQGNFDLNGAIHRKAETTCPLGDGHIVNIGKMIEQVEGNLRTMIGEVSEG